MCSRTIVMQNLAWLACACVCCGIALAGADEAPETFRQIIAKRPTPKLEGLAERSSPEKQGDTATESFWDLLKLRDQPNPAAVPELAKILSIHEGSTRIHGFAAAQALFTAGTEEARRILEEPLLAPLYPAVPAIVYTSHWQMAEPQRSRFIETYLLRDLADDLRVSVQARWSAEENADKNSAGADQRAESGGGVFGKNLQVTVTLVNESQRELALLVEQQYQSMAIHLRGPSGTFAPQSRRVVYGPDPGRWVRLQQGESTSFDVTLEMKTDAATLANAQKFTRNAEPIKAFLKSPDTGFALSELGKHQLSAMIVRTPLLEEQKQSLRKREGIDPSAVWTGRAVSKPVEVDLEGPAP